MNKKYILLIIMALSLLACGDELLTSQPLSTSSGDKTTQRTGDVATDLPSDDSSPQGNEDSRQNKVQIKQVQLLLQDVSVSGRLDLCLGQQALLSLDLSLSDGSMLNVNNVYRQLPIKWGIIGRDIFSIDESNHLIASKTGQAFLTVFHPEFGRIYLVQVWDCSAPLASPTPVVTPVALTPAPATPTPEATPTPTPAAFTASGLVLSHQLVILGELNDDEPIRFFKTNDQNMTQLMTQVELSQLNFESSNAAVANLSSDGAISGNTNGCAKISVTWLNYQTTLYVARGLSPLVAKNDAYADRVVCFIPGVGAGFGMANFPQNILGGPKGGGNGGAGLDVLSLGNGGEIILESETAVMDGPGADLIVFENPFLVGGNPANPFKELGQVSVSANGDQFLDFNCQKNDAAHLWPGCAGVHPVLANVSTNQINPLDPNVAGGDVFDLQQLGVSETRYIKIKDLANGGGGGAAGFDLDALSFVH